MSKLLSQREFAKEIGRSHVWVSKLVKSGKLPVIDGKIPLEAGLKAYKDSQQLGYEANREHGQKQREEAAKKENKPVSTPKQQDHAISLPDDDEPLPTTSSLTSDKVTAAFNRARLAEKTFMAKLKELDFKEKQGLLIPKDQVEQDAAAIAEELRGLLFAIGPRIAPICEGKPAREIEVIIEEAINDSLTSLKKSRFQS